MEVNKPVFSSGWSSRLHMDFIRVHHLDLLRQTPSSSSEEAAFKKGCEQLDPTDLISSFSGNAIAAGCNEIISTPHTKSPIPNKTATTCHQNNLSHWL